MEGVGWGDDWDDDWDDDVEWAKYQDWDRLEDTGGGIQLGLTADTLRNLYINAGACELYIKESQNDHVWIDANGNAEDLRYHVEGGDTLRMVRKPDWVFWNWERGKVESVTKVYLYLPADTYLNYAEIYFGAGNLESMELKSREVDVEVGAGTCTFNGLMVTDAVEMSAGAGQINVDRLDANDVDIEAGVGQIYVKNARINQDADITIGVGEVDFAGTIMGNLDLECDLGNAILRMDGSEEEHNYEIECSLGNVSIGNMTYTSLGEEKSIDHGRGSTFEIECALGNVRVSFAK